MSTGGGCDARGGSEGGKDLGAGRAVRVAGKLDRGASRPRAQGASAAAASRRVGMWAHMSHDCRAARTLACHDKVLVRVWPPPAGGDQLSIRASPVTLH